MTNTTVVPHLSGILRSSPFQQGAARYSPTKIAREVVCTCQTYSRGGAVSDTLANGVAEAACLITAGSGGVTLPKSLLLIET